MLRWTAERDIIVQIEVWDRFDYSTNNWEPASLQPQEQRQFHLRPVRLRRAVPRPPRPEQTAVLLHHAPTAQQHRGAQIPAAVRARRCSPTPCATTMSSIAWTTKPPPRRPGAFIGPDFIRERAQQAGKQVCLTEMWDAWDLKADGTPAHLRSSRTLRLLRRLPEQPEEGPGALGQLPVGARPAGRSRPRPLNTVKTYGADGGRFGNNRDGIERFWRHRDRRRRFRPVSPTRLRSWLVRPGRRRLAGRPQTRVAHQAVGGRTGQHAPERSRRQRGLPRRPAPPRPTPSTSPTADPWASTCRKPQAASLCVGLTSPPANGQSRTHSRAAPW